MWLPKLRRTAHFRRAEKSLDVRGEVGFTCAAEGSLHRRRVIVIRVVTSLVTLDNFFDGLVAAHLSISGLVAGGGGGWTRWRTSFFLFSPPPDSKSTTRPRKKSSKQSSIDDHACKWYRAAYAADHDRTQDFMRRPSDR